MKCFICDSELQREMILTTNDALILGFYAIVVKNVQFAICGDCFMLWNRVIEFLLTRFKEQKHIDEEICKKILEYPKET